MNILTINQTDFIVGGSDIYWKYLNRSLVKSGHEVYSFYASNKNPEMPSILNFNDGKIKNTIDYLYRVDSAKKLNLFLNDKKIDIAHLNIYHGQLSSSIVDVLHKRKIPIVQTLHEYKVVCPVYTMYRNGRQCFECKGGRFFNGIKNKCSKKSYLKSAVVVFEQYVKDFLRVNEKISRFICVSDYQKSLIEEMGFRGHDINVLHNFLPPFPESLFNEINKVSTPIFFEKYILYFGRIEEEKGVRILIEAVNYLNSYLPDKINLVVAGGGGMLDCYKKELSSGNVFFTGNLERSLLMDLISNSEFCVMPSLWPETFGLNILESFFFSKAVVVSDLGGMKEIVSHGIDGYVYSSSNNIELSKYIRTLWLNSELSRDMGCAGKQKVENYYLIEKYTKDILRIYKEVLNDSSN